MCPQKNGNDKNITESPVWSIPDFGNSNSANWIFPLMLIEKNEVIFPFSGIEQTQWWHDQSQLSNLIIIILLKVA